MSFYRQMEVFRAVMTCGSLTGAADRLLVTQPAISKQLQALEGHLRVQLFHREGGRVRPTDAARDLFAQSERAFASMHSLNRFALELARSAPKHVRICAMPMISRLWLPGKLDIVLEQHPDLSVTISTATSAQIMDLIETDQIDIGIALPVRPVGSCITEPLIRTRAVCVFPVGHALSKFDEVTPADIAGEHFLLLGPVVATRRSILDAFAEYGIQPRIRAEIDVADLAISLVAGGHGVSVIDDMTARTYEGLGKQIEMRPFKPILDLEIAIYLNHSVSEVPKARQVFEELLTGASH